jgi:site-specific recombinase XerD
MLCEFFPRGYGRYEGSPFARDLQDFGAWLEATGYSRQCARGHLFRLRDSLEQFSPAKLGAVYTVAQLESAFGTKQKRVSARRSLLYRATGRAFQRFLASRQRLAIAPVDDPFAELRRLYRRELLEVRGLSEETVQQHDRTVGDFLSHTILVRQSLSSLHSADVDRYLGFKGRVVGRQRLQHVVAHVRAFLGFCRVIGQIARPLEMIDTVRVHGDELPPRALAWPIIQGLLRSIDLSSRSGWRDYAILHLMAHYGLRPSEIVSLRLDSIVWSGRTMKVVQSKTHSTLILPLADQTISIIQQYLQCGDRDSRYPQLFLRARCPAGALTRYAIADIFDARAEQSGLPIEGYSAYSLRHAFAMRLLERGIGLKAIGDLLGHRHLGSTCQYLRLDIDTLRDVALPVPTQAQI